jgi:O-antigen/teichoic acid export membrane protein
MSKLKAHLSDKQGFVRNFSLLTISNMLASAVNLLVNMYLARSVSIEVYGQYGILISWSNILLVISSLGLQQIVIRYISRNQQNSVYYFKFGLFARLIGYLLMGFVFFVYLKITGGFNLNISILLLAYVFLLSLWDGIQNVAFGMQRMEFTGYIRLFGNLLLLVTYIILPEKLISVELLFLGLMIIQLIKDLLYLWICKRQNLFTIAKDKYDDKRIILPMLVKQSFPYYILMVFSLFTLQFPLLFLESNSSLTEVAYFNASNKLTVPLALVFATAMTALFPNLAQLYHVDKNKFNKYVRNSLTFLVIGGSVFCFIISLFRREFVFFIYGEEFKATGLVLATQTWFILFSAIFSLFGNIFGASDKQNMLAKLSIVYALVNTPILWFLSYYGAQYLSYGYIIGGIINLTYHFWFFQKCLPQKISNKLTLGLISFLSFFIVISLLIPESIKLTYKFYLLLLVVSLLIILLKKNKLSFIN